jgi:hypothetical protein
MNIDPADIAKAAPGAVGALLGAIRARQMGWAQLLTAFAGGVACSHWLPQPLLHLFPWVSHGAAAFLLGLFGMSLAAKVFELIDNLQPLDLLQKLWSKKP